jgi:hypothetical protein
MANRTRSRGEKPETIIAPNKLRIDAPSQTGEGENGEQLN